MSTNDPRPAWWPDDWEWPPKLSNEPELRKSLEPLVEKDDPYSNCKSFEDCCKVLFECNAQMRKFFGKDSKSLKALEPIKRCQHNIKQGLDGEAVCIKCNEDLGWYCPSSREHVCEYTDIHECCVYCGQPEERQ